MKNKNIVILLASSSVSDIANWIYRISVLTYVVNEYNSAFSSAVVSILMVLPSVILGFWAGKVADVNNKKHIMIISDFIRIVMMVFMVFMSNLGIIIILIVSSAAVFSDVCEDSIVPELVEKKDLARLNSVYSFISSGLMIVGPIIGGIVATYLTTISTLVLLIALLSVAVSIRACLNYTSQNRGPSAENTPVSKSFIDIISYARKKPTLFSILSSTGLVSLSAGMLNALLIIFVYQILGKDSTDYGVLLSAKGIAMTISSIFLIGIINKLNNKKLYIASLAGMGGALLLFSICRIWILSIVIQCINAICNMAFSVTRKTLIQQNCETAFMGRFFGTLVVISNVASVLSLVIFGSVSDVIGVAASFQIGALLIIVSSIIAIVAFSREAVKRFR